MDLLKTYLFETPWWITVAAAVLAAGVFGYGLLKSDPKIRKIGIGAVIVAVLWLAAGLLVTTAREQAIETTRAIVKAYNDEDWPALRTHIDQYTRFDNYLVGEQITDAAERTREALGQEGASVSDISAVQDSAGVRVRVTVTSLHAGPVPRLKTLWQFEYVMRDGELKLDRITPMDSEQFDADEIRRNVRSPVRRP